MKSFAGTVFDDDVVRAHELVREFFNGDDSKTRMWFRTTNPLLGVPPDTLIGLGRARKLLDFIKGQLAENDRRGSGS